MRLRRWFVVSAVLACGGAASQPEFEVIALDGDRAPGIEPPQTLQLKRGQPAWIDDRGRVVLLAGFDSPPSATGLFDSLWSWDDGALSLLLRVVGPGFGAGLPDGALDTITGWEFTPGGRLLVEGKLASGDRGLWQRARGGSFERIALGGEGAPGLPGDMEFSTLLLLRGRESARQAFFSGLSGLPSFMNESAWLQDEAGVPRLLALQGDPVPGVVPAAEFAGVPRVESDLVPVGTRDVVFRASLREPLTNEDLGSALLRGVPGSLDVLVREGDAVAPDRWVDAVTSVEGWLGGSRVLARLQLGSKNDTPPLQSPTFDSHVAIGDGAPRILFQVGEPARDRDGLPRPGATLVVIGPAQVSPGARFAVVGGLIDETAIGGPPFPFFRGASFWTNGEVVREVFRQGEPAPGLPGYAFVSSVSAVSRLGQVALRNAAEIPGVGGPAVTGLWIEDRRGDLRPVLLAGDAIDVGRGDEPDVREIAIVDFSARSLPPASFGQVINGAGDVVVSVEFIDGSHGVLLVRDPTPCIADVNGDGVLGPADLMAWVAAFSGGTPICDQNRDGRCDTADFNAWVLNYNRGCDGP